MSVTNSDSDSIDYEATGKTMAELAAEDALDELPERFEKHSKILNPDSYTDYALYLVPETGMILEGEECNHLMTKNNYQTMLENGFTVGMVTDSARHGKGVKFYFNFDGQ